jgi:hypothetical protein
MPIDSTGIARRATIALVSDTADPAAPQRSPRIERKSSARIDGPLAPLTEKRRSSVAGPSSVLSNTAVLSDFKIQSIRELAIAARDRPLTELETIISQTYMDPDHLRAIVVASKAMGVAVSFRDAGKATLKRLRNGAAPKMHGLDENSIKLASLERAYGDQAPQRLKQMEEHDIDGFVGHWENNRLIGIHVSDAAMKDEAFKAKLVDVPKDRKDVPPGRKYYPVDHNDLGKSLAGRPPDSYFMTGDYDIHDLIHMQGNRAPVSAGSYEERRVRQAIIVAIAAVDARRPEGRSDLWVIQHGSQYSYLAHMLFNESDTTPKESVMKPSLPVAMFVRGAARMITNQYELEQCYADLGVHHKAGWGATPPGSRRGSRTASVSSESGGGSDARRASSGTTGSGIRRVSSSGPGPGPGASSGAGSGPGSHGRPPISQRTSSREPASTLATERRGSEQAPHLLPVNDPLRERPPNSSALRKRTSASKVVDATAAAQTLDPASAFLYKPV